ncbi:unnamed protein product [Protopolystoma xenopodis]|uniref:SLC12A transporter C-terminal domain-containing protein n=1 Tax=Protopolystoma xenopodis TaxID=117903 RepID=A0A3S5CV66_9PLAT|nr:unnamed protein product [Protopolystoma xenopodis]
MNELLREHSSEAALVLISLPGPSRNQGSEFHYMDYVETLCHGLKRVLLIRGTGQEVITAFAE